MTQVNFTAKLYPTFPSPDITHNYVAHAKLFGNGPSLSVLCACHQAANFKCLFSGDLRVRMTIAEMLTRMAASFCISIRSIIRSGAEKQMVRIHAGTVITMMAYLQTFWDSTIGQGIGNTVSALGPPGTPTNPKLSVPIWTKIGSPIPTRTISVDFGPEAISDRNGRLPRHFAILLVRIRGATLRAIAVAPELSATQIIPQR